MEYWNPYIETLPREEMEKVELSYFKNILSYAKDRSILYREKLRGIEANDINSLEDIRRIPLTGKEELRRYQEMEPYPYGGVLGVDIKEVTVFRQSSGTTGKPVYVPETYESWQWRIETWCHILYMTGFRARHRVFLPFGYNVYVAFWEAHYASEKVGCELVPGGALDTKGRIYKIIETRANAMMNTPTYGLHIAEEAKSMGIAPESLGIERMLCAGEPMPEATRKRLEELYHCHVFDHIGGTEPCAWGSMCEAKQGLHIIEPFFLVEVLDRETLQKEVDEGQMGVAVVTPLGRRSFPLIRFNTYDVVIKGKADCSCGRTWKKISEVVGRADDLRKIRGVLFSPKTVEALIREEFQEIVEYEMMVERKGIMDEVNIRIEIDPSAESKGKEIEKRLKEKLKIRTNLSFQTKIESLGTLPRYTLKAKRFKDERER